MAVSHETDYKKPLAKLDDYKPLGNSGIKVSPICLGCMNFGDKWKNWIGETPKPEAKKIFDNYCDAGGNFIDTANFYHEGESEEWLGEFMKERGNRENMVVATKYSFPNPTKNFNAMGNNRKNMQYAVKNSLKRLQTDYIDILYIHFWDWGTPPMEILRGLDDLVKQGKVHYLGVSDTPAWQVARMNTLAQDHALTPFVLYQGRHSIGERTLELDILTMCREMGLGICPWNVFGAGKYLGKYDRKDGVPRQIRNNVITEHDFDVSDAVVAVSKEVGRSPAQVIVNWTLLIPGMTAPIIGSRTFQQYEDSVKGLEFTLTEAQVKKLNDAAKFTPYFPYDFCGTSWETHPVAHPSKGAWKKD